MYVMYAVMFMTPRWVIGTAFEDLPEGWLCPLCGVGTDEFSEE